MDKGRVFRQLHEGHEIFLMPNPWDPETTMLLASLGFKALATSSAGFAFSRGLPDGGSAASSCRRARRHPEDHVKMQSRRCWSRVP